MQQVHALLVCSHPTCLPCTQARTQAGARSGQQVALGQPGVTVLPGVVTPGGMFALNPAVGTGSSQGGSVRMLSLVVTSLAAAQPKVLHCTATCRHYMACSSIVRSRVHDMRDDLRSDPACHMLALAVEVLHVAQRHSWCSRRAQDALTCRW